jgi:CHRD domain-containing protein
MRSRLLVPVFALALTGAVVSCGDDITALDQTFQEDATWQATLASEVAGVPATATGRSWLVDKGNSIDFYMEYSGLTSNVTNAHIHRTATSAVMVQLPFVRQTSGVVVSTIDVSAGVTDISSEAGTQTVAEFRTLLANGGAYVNVHTVNNPGGEVRGTITPR